MFEFENVGEGIIEAKIKMLFKRISALGVVLVFLFLVSCQKEEVKNANSSDTTMPISYHTIPVPEDGWSGEEAIKTFTDINFLKISQLKV
jgi:hypothetical protein